MAFGIRRARTTMGRRTGAPVFD